MLFFIIGAVAAAEIAMLAYLNWLRVMRWLPGEEQDYGAIYEYLWFAVFVCFVLGLAQQVV